MGTTVLVTGGSGLVGNGIRLALEDTSSPLKRDDEKWIFLSSRDVDLTDSGATRAYFERVRPTYVIHLAAKVGGYSETYGVLYTCVIPTNVFGPFDNFDINQGHVIPGLIHKAYLAKSNAYSLV